MSAPIAPEVTTEGGQDPKQAAKQIAAEAIAAARDRGDLTPPPALAHVKSNVAVPVSRFEQTRVGTDCYLVVAIDSRFQIRHEAFLMINLDGLGALVILGHGCRSQRKG